MEIVGWYTCNPLLGGDAPKPVALKIIRAIDDNTNTYDTNGSTKEPVLAVIQSEGLESLLSLLDTTNENETTTSGIQFYGSTTSMDSKQWTHQYPPKYVLSKSSKNDWTLSLSVVTKVCASYFRTNTNIPQHGRNQNNTKNPVTICNFEDHLKGFSKEDYDKNDWIRNESVKWFVQLIKSWCYLLPELRLRIKYKNPNGNDP